MKDKIITIIPSLYEGGAEKFAADLSIGLSNTFDHTTVVYNHTKNKYAYSGKLIELTIAQRTMPLIRLWRQFKIVKRLKRLKLRERPKVSISHMLMANMLNILSRKGESTICVLHGEWSVKTGRSALLKRYVQKQYKKADRIISVSHYIREMFDSYYQLDVPHEVIHIGVPIKKIEAMGNEISELPLPDNYVVYVAGFRPVKNHLKLLEQLEDYLKTSEISLVLVGDGPLRTEIEQEIESRGLAEKVILLGNLTNPYPVIKKAKASLLVSSSESFSIVVVESMVLGVPVIATDCGGPREIIAPNLKYGALLPMQTDNGILIPHPNDWKHNMLGAQLNELLGNPVNCNSLSEKGKKRAKDFSIEHSEKKFRQLIENLIANKG